MSTPPPPPSGFQPASAPAPQGKSKKGCIVAAVVVLFLLIAGCFGACYMAGKNAGKLMAWGLEKMRPQLVAIMDSDADQTVKDRFLAEFDAQLAVAKDGVGSDAAGEQMQSLAQLMQVLQEVMGDQRLTAEEMERFIAASRQARGAPAMAPAADPAADPAAEPTAEPTADPAAEETGTTD